MLGWNQNYNHLFTNVIFQKVNILTRIKAGNHYSTCISIYFVKCFRKKLQLLSITKG